MDGRKGLGHRQLGWVTWITKARSKSQEARVRSQGVERLESGAEEPELGTEELRSWCQGLKSPEDKPESRADQGILIKQETQHGSLFPDSLLLSLLGL